MTGQHDPVEHPKHYCAGGIECIDAIEAAIASQSDPTEAFLTGQVIKYLWRYPLKNGAEDLRKARWYLDRLISKAETPKERAALDSRNVAYQEALPWQDEVETIIEPARADAFCQEYVWAWTSVSDWIGYWKLNEKRNLSAKDITPALNRLKIEKNEKSVHSNATGKTYGAGKARLLPFRHGDAKPATREKPP